MATHKLLAAFGKEVRRRRIALGLSQEQLAELAGLHRNFIGLIERGERNPTLLTLVGMSRALQITPAELIGALDSRG